MFLFWPMRIQNTSHIPRFILLLLFHLYLDLSGGLLLQILQHKLFMYFSSLSLSLSLCLMHVKFPPRPLSFTSTCSLLKYLKIFVWRNCQARDNVKTKADGCFCSPDCHFCLQDSLRHSRYKVLKHDFRVTKHCFSIQFLHANAYISFWRFQARIVMLMTTHLYLNVMQCRLVYKYQLSPISDSSWRWKLGQSLI